MASKAMSSEEAGPFKAAEDYAMGWYLKQPDRIGNASPEPTFHNLIKQFCKICSNNYERRDEKKGRLIGCLKNYLPFVVNSVNEQLRHRRLHDELVKRTVDGEALPAITKATTAACLLWGEGVWDLCRGVRALQALDSTSVLVRPLAQLFLTGSSPRQRSCS